MDEWFENINWSGACIRCKEENNGQCPDLDCAKYHYDVDGNKIPLKAWHADGDTLHKYKLKGK